MSKKTNHLELSKLNQIKIESAIVRDRVGEVLETFFINKDTHTHTEELTSLLWSYEVIDQRQVERLEVFLKRIGKSLWDSAHEYDKAKLRERLNVPKKKNNRGSENYLRNN